MDNCFVCDSYFYPIKQDPDSKEDEESETNASSVLDSSKVVNFCESMDISPIPENSDGTEVPLCHRCSITASKILLIQEQITHLQNQVSQLQYSLAEKALITYYNNQEEDSEEDQLKAQSTTMGVIQKLLRDRWEEPTAEKSDSGGGDAAESFRYSKENNEDFNNTNKKFHSSGYDEKDDEGETPATKRPASFEWSQNARKKAQFEPNILYVNLGEPQQLNYNLMNDENEASAISIPDSANDDYDEDDRETHWSIRENGEMENLAYGENDEEEEDDDVIVEKTVTANKYQIPNMTIIDPSSAISIQYPGTSTFNSGGFMSYNPALKISSASGRSEDFKYSSTSPDRKISRLCPFADCRKEFTNSDRYTEHINMHNGNAPSCDICKKVFPRKYNLRIHMRTHTGEKPHKCPICLAKYADKSNLNAHIRKHYEKPFHCSVCRRMFDDIASSQSHVTTFHPDRTERNLIRLTRLIPKEQSKIALATCTMVK